MKVETRLTVIMVAVALIFSIAHIANAGDMAQQPQGARDAIFVGGSNVKVVPVISWSEQGVPTSPSTGGAVRVDRDFGAYSQDDVNLYGYDQAYNSSSGRKNRESDYQSTHWIPDTYGHMGNYGRDSNGP